VCLWNPGPTLRPEILSWISAKMSRVFPSRFLLHPLPKPLYRKTFLPSLHPPPSCLPMILTPTSRALTPRALERYGSFDSKQGNLDIMNDTLALQIKSQENVEDRLSAPPKTRRERVSSTSTAIIIRESAESRPILTTNLITSRSRVASKNV
jgi:hypothetical protein